MKRGTRSRKFYRSSRVSSQRSDEQSKQFQGSQGFQRAEYLQRIVEILLGNLDILRPHGIVSNYGPDVYYCRGCGMSEDVMGYALGTQDINHHEDDCSYVEIRNILGFLEDEDG